MKLWNVSRILFRLSQAVGDADALISRNPARIGRRVANRVIGKVINHTTKGMYLQGKKRKQNENES